ncbi:MAG: hypothetical protein ACLFQK_01510 [Fibrobacterota bacterium]
MKNFGLKGLLGFFIFLFCASPLVDYDSIRKTAAEGNFESAYGALDSSMERYGEKNLALYHLDKGLLSHYAKMTGNSRQHFFRAEDLMEEYSVMSVSREAASVVTNENVKEYAGMDYERALSYFFNAANFLSEGDLEGAQVEGRRGRLIIKELQSRYSGKARYKDEVLLRALNGLMHEVSGEYDDAYISYYRYFKVCREQNETLNMSIMKRLIYLAKRQERSDDLLEILGYYPEGKNFDVEERLVSALVFAGYAGRGPALTQKKFSGSFADSRGHTHHLTFAVPEFLEQPSSADGFGLTLRKDNGMEIFASSAEQIRNINRVSKENLKDRMPSIIRKTATRVLAKTIANEKIKNKIYGGNPVLNLIKGIVVDSFFEALEQTDTRICNLLPGRVFLTVIPVNEGDYVFSVRASDGSLNESHAVNVNKNQKLYYVSNAALW